MSRDFADNKPWWKEAVFYHIYPRSFYDTTGNGIGDLAGVIAKLDYLVELGVDALWISPFYPSPMVDFGYDITDHTAVDPLFGDLNILDRLIEAAHTRGLKLLLDYIPNHTSIEHPWFIQSRSSRENPKREWYLWKDPRPEGTPPTNWASQFGGPAWTFDEATGQFYMHTFLREQPDLNWRNPAVQAAMLDVLRFWMDRGVDGFRIDAITYLIKDDQWRDNPPLPEVLPGKDRGDSGRQKHLYDSNLPENHEVVRRLRRTLDEYPGEKVMAGEAYVFDPALAAEYFGTGDECQLVYNFLMLNQPWRAAELRAAYEGLQERVPASGEMALILGGHDESRLASRYGRQAVRSAAVLLLTLKGTPFIYYADELGLEDVPVPPHRLQDPWPLRAGLPELSRDPARTPMLWSGEAGAGFSRPAPRGDLPEPWLPLSPRWAEVNVERQRGNPDSIWSFYRQLLALRRRRPSLHRGQYLAVELGSDGVWAYLRRSEGETTLIAINFGSDPMTVDHESGPCELLLSTAADPPSPPGPNTLVLRAHEALILGVDPS